MPKEKTVTKSNQNVYLKDVKDNCKGYQLNIAGELIFINLLAKYSKKLNM